MSYANVKVWNSRRLESYKSAQYGGSTQNMRVWNMHGMVVAQGGDACPFPDTMDMVTVWGWDQRKGKYRLLRTVRNASARVCTMHYNNNSTSCRV